jgi:hypothetical protein
VKLSEAIRAGMDDVEENHGDYLFKDQTDGQWCGCALGTAAFALNAIRFEHPALEERVQGPVIYNLLRMDIEGLEDVVPWPEDLELDHGEEDAPDIRLIRQVDILHSRYSWSREDIATWLESIGR